MEIPALQQIHTMYKNYQEASGWAAILMLSGGRRE